MSGGPDPPAAACAAPTEPCHLHMQPAEIKPDWPARCLRSSRAIDRRVLHGHGYKLGLRGCSLRAASESVLLVECGRGRARRDRSSDGGMPSQRARRDSDPGVLIPYPRLGRAFNLLEHGGIGGGRAVPAARPASGCRARSRARGERRERASARGPDSPGCARACDRLADGVRAVRRALPRAWVPLERRTALAPMVCAAPRAAAADASEVARRANAHRSARRLDRCQWARPRVRGIM